MRVYENAKNCYDEIKTWYPAWYQEVLEMDAILRASGTQLDEMRAGILQALANNNIKTADKQSIAKLEEFLYITYDGPRDLVERRNVVSALLNSASHIGQTEIKEYISIFTSGKIDVDFIDGTIKVLVTRDYSDPFNLYDCRLVLDRRIPGHLALDLIDNILPTKVQNNEQLVFQKFNVNFSVKEELETIKSKFFYFGGSVLNNERLSGTITMDSRWTLDGTVKLDGSRKLISKLIQEDL